MFRFINYSAGHCQRPAVNRQAERYRQAARVPGTCCDVLQCFLIIKLMCHLCFTGGDRQEAGVAQPEHVNKSRGTARAVIQLRNMCYGE